MEKRTGGDSWKIGGVCDVGRGKRNGGKGGKKQW
jgi:hypothetical protein